MIWRPDSKAFAVADYARKFTGYSVWVLWKGTWLETYMDGELPNPPVHYNMSNYAFEESHFRWAKDGTFSFLVEGGAINPNDTQDPGVTAIVKAQISDEIMMLADGTSSPIVKILEIKHIRSVK